MTSPAAEALLGQTVGAYRIDELVGSGSAGHVYRAWHCDLERQVAIKLLTRPRDAEWLERFRREARAAARVEHPCVAQIFDVVDLEGAPFLVQEYVAGEPLEGLLGRGLPADELLRICGQVAAGLAQIHAAGLVHRDIKPSNVIVKENGDAKIVDFGLVSILDEASDLTKPGALVGTPLYMAPEQVGVSPGGVKPEADVFALGAVIYRGLCGHVPHDLQDRDLRGFLARRSKESPAFDAPELAPALSLLQAMLHSRPTERPSAEDVCQRLQTREPAPDGAQPPVTLLAGAVALVLVGAVLAMALGPDGAATAVSAAGTDSPAVTPAVSPATPAGTQPADGPVTPTPATPAPGTRELGTREPVTPTPVRSAPETIDVAALDAALLELQTLDFAAAEEALGRLSGPPAEVVAARRLLGLLQELNGDQPLSEEAASADVAAWVEHAPRTRGLIERFEPILSVHAHARAAAERGDFAALPAVFAPHKDAIAAGRRAGCLTPDRWPESGLLLRLARAKELEAADPAGALQVLRRIPPAMRRTPLAQRVADRVNAWVETLERRSP